MSSKLRNDATYVLLNEINERAHQGERGAHFDRSDFAAPSLENADVLHSFNYLLNNGFVEATVTNGKGRDKASEINLDNVKLTDKGQQWLQKMQRAYPEGVQTDSSVSISPDDLPFLEGVMVKAGINDIFDARDITVIVYRVMRDLMTTEAADRVAEELEGVPAEVSLDKTLQADVAELWKDTNPLVNFISRLRPPLQGRGNLGINAENFIFRVSNEGGLPPGVAPEAAIAAVFAATKQELSEVRQAEVASCLPGRILELWEHA